MLIAVPLGTDAPIYHWPFATVGLIVLNVVLLFAVPPEITGVVVDDDSGVVRVEEAPSESTFERYALTLGDGLHPVQWLTHAYLHMGVGHLVGNMLFLWAFGIVVEGKLGPWWFLVVYLAIGLLDGMMIQTMLLRLGDKIPAAGASANIFGLLAICMVWAPHNELQGHLLWFVGFRAGHREIQLRYTWVALLYIGEQVLHLALAGVTQAPPITEIGHLTGAVWGGVLAVLLVKRGWVDCEGWDIFSVLAKRKKLARDWKQRGERLDRAKVADRKVLRERIVAEDEAPSDEARAEAALKKVNKLIDMGDYASALNAYDKHARILPDWPSGPDLLALIKAMHAQQAEVDSLPLMRDYCRKHPKTSSRVGLKLAQVLIRDREKPAQALRILDGIAESALPPNLVVAHRQLVQKARQMLDEGVLELEGDD